MEEACLLEETLTGKECIFDSKSTNYPNISNLGNFELRETKIVEEYDENEKYRQSYLFENPIPVKSDQCYKTCLTGFIVMKQILVGTKSCFKITTKVDDYNDCYQFYINKGCFYHFHYCVMDFMVIKMLGKLITNDHLGVPAKSSLEAFGVTVKYLTENVCQTRVNFAEFIKKSSPLKSTSKITYFNDESAENVNNKPIEKHKEKSFKKKASKRKPTEIIIEKIDKATQEPEDIKDSIVLEHKERLKPGVTDWNYISLEIPKRFADVLATIWEYIEEIFCMDIREMFFVHRIGLDGKVPRIYYVKRITSLVMFQPDNKQDYIEDFQKFYNEIDDDLRHDVEMKAEIHFRIEELRRNLLDIVEENFERSMELRQYLIKQCSLPKEIYVFSNYYFIGLELETNRCLNTLKLLMDYYSAMITKKPCLEKLFDDFHLQTEVTFEDNKEFEGICNFLRAVVTLQIVYTDPSNPIVTIIHSNYNKCIDVVENAITISKNYVKKTQTLLNSKDSKKLTEDVLKRFRDIIDEWNCAILGEYNRILLKLQLFRDEALGEMFELTQYSIIISTQKLEINLQRKQTETQAVSIVCNVFAHAAETETKLQPRLFLDGDCFSVQPDLLEFADELPPPENEEHDLFEIFFDVEELNKLTEILLQISPNFIILERALVYLLQDLIMHHVKDRKSLKMPNYWYSMKPAQISSIIPKLFGMEPYLDWREFIIYNLNLAFPTSNELLDTRQQFRNFDPNRTECVLMYQFHSVQFWFEKSLHKQQNLVNIKTLLGKLYSVKNDYVNYSKLLLTFCKDEILINGVGKALELSLGKRVCKTEIEGNEYIENYRAKCLRLKEHRENIEMVQNLLDQYLDECEISGENSLFDLTCEDNTMPESFNYIFTEESSRESSLKDETDKIYFLPFETVIAVLSEAILSFSYSDARKRPSMRFKVEHIYKELRNKEFGNRVFVHEFLNCKSFKDLFKKSFKFTEKYLPKVIMQTFTDE